MSSFNSVPRIFKLGFSTLNSKEKRKFILLILLQIIMVFLDLLGVALLGVLGSLSVFGVSSKQPTSQILELLSIIGIQNNSLQVQAGVLAIIAVSTLTLRSFLSIFVMKKTLFLLSKKSVEATETILKNLLELGPLHFQRLSTSEIVYNTTSGVAAVYIGVMGGAVILISDFALAISMFSILFIFDFVTALAAVGSFLILGWVLYFNSTRKIATTSRFASELEIKSNQAILNVLELYRETFVQNVQDFYINTVKKTKLQNTKSVAELVMMQNMGKYVIEIGVFLIALLLGATQFLLNNASNAVSTLSVFLAAGLRISPAVLRIQQSLVQIKSGQGTSKYALEWMKNMDKKQSLLLSKENIEFVPSVILQNVDFKFPESQSNLFKNVSIEIKPKTFIAVVGPSGSGKSTLIDLILGIYPPDSGRIEVSGYEAHLVSKIWPGKISYVPQFPKFIRATIAENIALGCELHEIDFEQIGKCLRDVHLDQQIFGRLNGVNSFVEENGINFSGGQRQKLAIARALYSNPELLVFDEVTSSLDGSSEQEITQLIAELKERCTIVAIAHRLSTVRHADTVYLLEKGLLLKKRGIEDMNSHIPDSSKKEN